MFIILFKCSFRHSDYEKISEVDSKTRAFLSIFDQSGQKAENLTVGDLAKIEISVEPQNRKVTLKNCFVHGETTEIPIIENGRVIPLFEGAVRSIRKFVHNVK